jgi:hypothetical protein
MGVTTALRLERTVTPGMGLTTTVRMGLTTSLLMNPCLGKGAPDSLGNGGADSVYLPDERRHPGQENDEVQQDVEGQGDRPYG